MALAYITHKKKIKKKCGGGFECELASGLSYLCLFHSYSTLLLWSVPKINCSSVGLLLILTVFLKTSKGHLGDNKMYQFKSH